MTVPEESVVVFNLTTTLISSVEEGKPYYPNNWMFDTKFITALALLIQKYEIVNIVVLSNISYMNGAFCHPEKFKIFLSDVCSQLQLYLNSTIYGNKKVSVISHFGDSNKGEWFYPSVVPLNYLAEIYKLDLFNSIMVVGNDQDRTFADAADIKIKMTPSEIIRTAYTGGFN